MSTRDRVHGVVFGTAIGDALGYPVEFYNPRNVSGLVLTDLDGRRCAPYSDDTQMMLATFRGLIGTPWYSDVAEHVDATALKVAREYVAWSVSPENNRAPGGACMFGCHQLRQGVDWRVSGKPGGGGCGAAMRSMAYGTVFATDLQRAVTMAAEHALMTHGSEMARASAAAVAAGVAMALERGRPHEVGGEMYIAANRYDKETAAMIRRAVADALDGTPPREVLDRWRGWAGHEAVAASLYCYLRHPDDYEAAVLEAVNSPGDSDSLGAITGALSGATLGVEAIREDWLRDIEKGPHLGEVGDRIWNAYENVRDTVDARDRR